ncbi:MAG: hypothetical protein FWC32_10425, partial [Firmicutes bacterium]|nr:hypothetical protein [Bacillota bacterium]
MNPRLGRWTQPDPFFHMRFGQARMMGSPNAIAQAGNLFLFTMNNPVGWMDPTGLFAQCALCCCGFIPIPWSPRATSPWDTSRRNPNAPVNQENASNSSNTVTTPTIHPGVMGALQPSAIGGGMAISAFLAFCPSWAVKFYKAAIKYIPKAGQQIVSTTSRAWNAVSGLFSRGSADIVFGSATKSAQKLADQMARRGWNESSVINTIRNPHTTREAFNRATNNPATAFFNKDGSHVIVDNITREVIQISNRLGEWIPDSSIINPFIP